MSEHPGPRYVQRENLPDFLYVDWRAAPGSFKLYRDCRRLPLHFESSGRSSSRTGDTLTGDQLGQMLFDIYGLTRQRRMSAAAFRGFSGGYMPVWRDGRVKPFEVSLLRPVPSGGALFPCELYLLVGRGQSVPPGIYHYDAMHHALDLLRAGDYSTMLNACLAEPACTSPALVILLSCLFWKNGFKYGELSYRLQSLDIGIVTEQSRVVSSRYDMQVTVHYQFLDLLINRLLGLEYTCESVYAVITLDTQTTKVSDLLDKSSLTLIEQLPMQAGTVIEHPKSIAQWPLLEELHAASLIKIPELFRTTRSLAPVTYPPVQAGQALPQVALKLDLLQGLRSRHSASSYFVSRPLTRQQLAALLVASTRGYASDLDGQPSTLQHTLLYCVINAVEGIAPGVYIYDVEQGILGTVQAGDVSSEIQATLAGPSHNMRHISVCFIPVANYDQGFQVHGDRWYRIQNMEGGIVAQRLSLLAAALELGCHIILAYHVSQTNILLRLPEGFTSLVQVLVAPEYHAGQYYEQAICY